MAAPSPTARTTPAGRKMDNGYKITVTIGVDPDISVWEKTITPPGLDQGDMIDTTTQHNADGVRSMAFRAFTTITEGSMEVGFNENYLTQIKSVIGVNTTLTFTLPNLGTIAAFGGVRTFEPTGLTDGEHPTATMALAITNTDPETGDIEAPVYTPPA